MSCAPFRGGADSDIMLDMLLRCGDPEKIHAVFLSTGVEYKATYEQLDFLEKKYGITIERVKPVKTVPACCKEIGLPFLSKRVSEYLSRMMALGFQFEDEPYSMLAQKYPNGKSKKESQDGPSASGFYPPTAHPASGNTTPSSDFALIEDVDTQLPF